jgi:hypothetical protein
MLSLSLVLVVVFAFIPAPALAAISDAEFEQIYQINLAVFSERSTSEEALEYYRQLDFSTQSDDAVIIDLAASITDGVSGDYAKARAIHDWVSYNIWYDYDDYEGRAAGVPQNALSVLTNKRGVCAGYTNLTVALLRAAGIPARYVLGYAFYNLPSATVELFFSGDSNHAWTEAYADDRWILIDTTWDSGNDYSNGVYSAQRAVGYTYFDISLRDILKTRTYAFWYDPFVTEAVIPDGATSFPGFSEYTKLKSVTIPDSVTSIGDGAFQSCTSLTSITIPSSVTSIGSGAFYNCTSLTSITIPDSVTSIGEYSFYKCTNLESITIPDGVTSIERGTFQDCSSLTSITIPSSVTSIGGMAFQYCTSLKSVSIPSSVINISYAAFSYCTGLTDLTIAATIESVGDIFTGSNNIKNITISGNIGTIGAWAFNNRASLESVTISGNVGSIGYAAFLSCTNLSNVTITGSVTTFGDFVFASCPNVTITAPAGSTAETYARANRIPFAVPAYPQARPAPGTVYVNGVARTFECYEVNGTTYFKLVDVGEALKNTPARFSITPSGGVLNLTLGAAFNDSSALNSQATATYNAMPPTATVTVNGRAVELKSYRINGLHYYEITPLGTALGITVGRDRSKIDATYPNGPITLTTAAGTTPALQAKPAPGTVYVNGVARTFECYEINGYTYFKLIDVGTALKDTTARFSINANPGGGLNLIKGEAYNNTVTSLNTAATNTYNATVNSNPILVNGTRVTLESYFVNGSSYYQITPLGNALGFAVARDPNRGNAITLTSP